MTGTRPDYIDLRSQTGDVTRIAIPSPRVEHFDGEIPPALSPLDAFAAQGRLLAKQLDESMRRDRRLSRLPPSSVARSLSQPRPGYFRSPSNESQRITRSPDHGSSPEVEEPKFRPQSEHPRLSGLSNFGGEDREDDQTPVKRPLEPQPGSDYFGALRAESPEEDLSLRKHNDGNRGLAVTGAFGGTALGISRESSMESVSRSNVLTTLAPPASPFPPPQSSSRSIHPESSDDDYTSSNAGSTFSKPRKLSSSSGMSMPHSPMSPFVRSHPRSPSLSSEASNTASYLPRPSFNFSRPLSRSSTSLSAPSPIIPPEPPVSNQPSSMNRDNRPAPITVPVQSDAPRQSGDGPPTSSVSSYIYAKYSLPRGRSVSRNSLVFSGLQTPHFEWQEPLFESSPPPSASHTDRFARTPSPPPASQASSLKTPERSMKASSVHGSPARSLQQSESASTTPLRQSADNRRPEMLPVAAPNRVMTSGGEDQDDAKSNSADSSSTLRPHTARTGASSAQHLTAEDHVAKGIECHEKGSLKESTYHLRIAAMQNHPTAMLLYALACRHGWGMRPNQREGVQWLRKAVDSAGLEVVDDSAAGPTKAKDIVEQKARRAQFALSIYELGVSHLNGWGIEQDKSLALRCFEIAGQWGDVDAMAEAGFCYAEGVGCKKDMKKAAKFYRMAEAKGMSMVGNSWIYKDKYMSEDESNPRARSRHSDTPEKKPRNKSRTRSIFGRKKITSIN